jgi:hypothetical protein
MCSIVKAFYTKGNDEIASTRRKRAKILRGYP